MAAERAGMRQCNRCRARIPANARRCMQCGAQIYVAPKHDADEAARLERERLIRKYKLTEVQSAILLAAADESGDRRIYVVGSDGQVVGEVKSGGLRFEGDEAVAAIAALAGPGLIRPVGDDCFKLTDDGTRLAGVLSVPDPA